MDKKLCKIRGPIWQGRSFIPSSLVVFFLLGLFSSCESNETETGTNVHPLMGAGYGIVSSTLLVKDLKSAREYYTETLGFSKPRKEEFEKGALAGTRSSTIRFPDNSKLELLSLDDSIKVTAQDAFIEDFLQDHEGVRTYSISSSSVKKSHSWLSQQGFEMDSIKYYAEGTDSPESPGWNDQVKELYTLNFAGPSPPSALPQFVKEGGVPYHRVDKDWNSFYNMQRGFFQHPNGVVGMTALQIAVEDLKTARAQFKKMGWRELGIDRSENLVRFELKRNQELHLKAAQSPDDEAAKFLEERGSGVLAMRFEVKDLQSTYDTLRTRLPVEALSLDTVRKRLTVFRAFAYGVQLEFEAEPEEQGLIAEKLQLNFAGKLDSTAIAHAESMYIKYCALCHGENREGYAADFAPSLRSHSLLSTSKGSNFMRYTVQFGREGTAMAGYLQDQGGPLEYIEIELLLKWLYESSGVEKPVELSRDPIAGDIELGASVYAERCTACHGENGEGISAPALGYPMLLATATDHFLRYAIAEGRDSTPMVAFKDSLSDVELDAVTAFLRSRASGWDVPENDSITLPAPEDYVLNPESSGPDFELREDRYLSAEQLKEALQDSMRLVLLDARSTVAWRQTHIPGAIPIPYYEEPEAFIQHLPKDSTWIVAYCACPHAASGRVINTLNKYGFKKTAILDEGILVWAELGYPVQHGQ